MVRAILASMPFRAVVETGTHRGITTGFLRRESGLTVHTVEVDRRYFYYATLRLCDDHGIVVRLGDSRRFLRHLAGDRSFPAQNVFFYLDAHWGQDLPLAEEVRLVSGSWDDWVAVIDDFEVPGDPGYGFDDYGPGRRLTLEDRAFDRVPGVEVYWPSLPSSRETGFRRGCVVLASSGKAARALRSLAVVRPHEPAPGRDGVLVDVPTGR